MSWSPPPIQPFSWTEAQKRYLADKLGELKIKEGSDDRRDDRGVAEHMINEAEDVEEIPE